MKLRCLLSIILPLFLAACGSEDSGRVGASAALSSQAAPAKRWYQFQHVAAGGKVFKEYCAACHGESAQGAPDWRKRLPDGKFPPPPLNGTGHGWHHPLRMLFQVVRHGSPGGQGNMPPWEGKLSDEEILSAIAWFQSKWPDEIYQVWAERDLASRQ
jgi:mono/diheme cytochrome c family protein